MNNSRKWILSFLGETTKDVIKRCIEIFLFGSGGFLLFSNLKKVGLFLNSEIIILKSLLFIFLLLAFLIGYEINKPRKDKHETYFKLYGNVLWYVTKHPNRKLTIEKIPFCPKCKTQYLEVGSHIFGQTNLSCPNLECEASEKEPIPLLSRNLELMREGALKTIEAEERKKSKR